jgi:hypothetical protein
LLHYRDALQQYTPHVVFCSWMPLGQDWTAAFRACASVSAYLLLGECDDGASGDPWATWGFNADGSCYDHCPSPGATRGDPAAAVRPKLSEWGFDEAGPYPGSCPCPSVRGDSPAAAMSLPVRAELSDLSSDCSEASASESGDANDPDAWRRVYEHSPHRTIWGVEGWTRQPVHAISAQQIGRTDAPWCSRRHSTAVCFSRASLVLASCEEEEKS